MLDTYKYAAIGLLAISLTAMTNLYLDKRDELAKFETRVDAAGKAAVVEKDRIEAEGVANLVKIKEDHESKVPEIRAGAVAAYLAHRVRVNPVGGAVPEARPGVALDDVVESQCVPDTTFIESAAEDAAKLEAWQDYARLNGIPVTE